MNVKTVYTFLISFSYVTFAFAIINTSSFGIPFFWIVGLFGYLLVNFKVEKRFFLNVVLVYFLLFVLLLAAHPTGVQLKQTIARLMMPISTLGAISFFNRYKTYQEKFINQSFWLLFIFFVYGVYEFFAKTAGLPLFFNGLTNNISFLVDRSILTSGWLETLRSRSIWPEPSSSALPVIVYFILLKVRRVRINLIFYFIPGLYGLLTVSRIVWIIVVLFYLYFFIERLLLYFNLFRDKLALRTIGLILILLLIFINFWPIFAAEYFSDLSFKGRSNSVIIGYRIFTDHLLFGTGFNTYSDYASNYIYDLSNYKEEANSLNIFTSYLQQGGIFALLFFISPMLYVWSNLAINREYKLFVVFIIVVAGSLAGDILYYGIYWMLIIVVPISKLPFKKMSSISV